MPLATMKDNFSPKLFSSLWLLLLCSLARDVAHWHRKMLYVGCECGKKIHIYSFKLVEVNIKTLLKV